MILTLNADFEGYTPVEVLGQGTRYREVYKAKSRSGEYVTLTVYNMNGLPSSMPAGKVAEFEIIPKLTGGALPKCIGEGSYTDNGMLLRWMATEYVDYMTLTDYLCSGNIAGERELLQQFYAILIAVHELSSRIGDGCVNNITTDNIAISMGSDGCMKWSLIGLNCVSEVCRGRATFDAKSLSRRFVAPETFVGHYNPKTDVFSLGVVLAMLLQGKHPWKDIVDDSVDISDVAYAKLVRTTVPLLELPEPLKTIVGKAIAVKPSERYRSAMELGMAIAYYLGNSNLESFESYTPAGNKVESPFAESNSESNCDDSLRTQSDSQPKANVRIERVSGNGFSDVAGMEQLKSVLTRNFVDIVQNRELASQFQITPPNGILLWGPPGTGKTFISRKLAEESGLLYTLVKPSDLGNTFIHGSQSMIADLFTRSEKLASKHKCGVLLVFDEFDSLVPRRDQDHGPHYANEVAEFLTRLNDCAEKNVFVVATTNRVDAIDSAVLRKGRLDEIIYVGLPDDKARKELLELELSKRPHEDVDTARIVELTKGYSSSDITYIVKESARWSFDQSIKSKSLVRINQAALERTIAATRPSVSDEELKYYEGLNKSFSKQGKVERRRIGF